MLRDCVIVKIGQPLPLDPRAQHALDLPHQRLVFLFHKRARLAHFFDAPGAVYTTPSQPVPTDRPDNPWVVFTTLSWLMF